MNYGNPQLRQMLAAEYALGTLQGPARRRFEVLLKDPHLRAELVFWETRLAQLGLDLAPVVPDARVWAAIERRIAGKQTQPRDDAGEAHEPWWRSLNLWRGGFAVSAAVSVVLAIMLWVSPAPTPEPVARPAMQYVSVIMSQENEPGWLFTADPDTRSMSLKAVPGHPAVPEGKDLELWMLPGGGQPPVSMAIVPRSGTVTVDMPPEMVAALKGADGLAVSLEPQGGSPTGQPTGPVLYTARIMSTR